MQKSIVEAVPQSLEDILKIWEGTPQEIQKHVANHPVTCHKMIVDLEQSGNREAASWARWMVWWLVLAEQRSERFAKQLREKEQSDSPDLELPINETFLVSTGAELYFDHGSKADYRYQLSDSLFLCVYLDNANDTVSVSLQDHSGADGYARLPHIKTRRQLLKLVEALGINSPNGESNAEAD